MGNTFVATADDPSAIYFNPAGLTQLDAPTLSLGAAVISLESKYEPTSGGSARMGSFIPVIPNLYYSTPIKTKWTAGFGVNAPFGLETHWNDNGPLRYMSTESNLAMINFNPTIAYEINDTLSIGAGIVYSVSNATLRSRVNETALNSFLSGSPTMSPDGGKKLEGYGDSWGYDLGVLYHVRTNHRLGLSYRSELQTHLKGNVELSGLSGASRGLFGGETYNTAAETDIKYPETVLLGYAYNPGRWTFELDGEWAHYSRLDETRITYTEETNPSRLGVLNTDNPIPRDWRNTWNVGLGVNYVFNDTWQTRGGYFHYPKVIPTETWEPSIPESSHNGYTVGGTFSRRSFSVDLAYNFIQLNKRTIHNDVGANSLATDDGNYKTTAHIFSANMNYKFGKAEK
jgi:long-chain fatty acid transport protein